MGLGDSWTDTTPGSPTKLNKVSIISGTGTYISGLSIANHILFRADDSTGGLIADHLYLCSADGLSLIDLSDTNEHNHSSTGTGGTMLDILNGNKDVFDSGSYLTINPFKAKWSEVVTGTASTADDIDGSTGEPSVKLSTGATISSVSNIRQLCMDFDASKRSYFKSVSRLPSTASVALRIGYGMDAWGAADSDSRKYGAEYCSTVNSNWWLRSATGSARSASDTGVAATTNRTSIRCEHYPDLGIPKIDIYINEGTVFTKTSNIPTTYLDNEPSPGNIFRVSLINNTGSDKLAYFYGTRLVFQVRPSWFN